MNLSQFQITEKELAFIGALVDRLRTPYFYMDDLSSGSNVGTAITIVSPIFQIGNVNAVDGKIENTPTQIGARNRLNLAICTSKPSIGASVATFTPYVKNGAPPGTIDGMTPLAAVNFATKWASDKAWILQDYNISSKYFAFKINMTLASPAIVECMGYFHE